MNRQVYEIGRLWREINIRVHDCFRQAFDGYDLPMAALFLLKQIKDHPGVTVSELSRHTRLAKSYVSRTTERLAQLGYIEARDDEADQRLKRLYLTEAAVSRMAEMETQSLSVWSRLLASLPEKKMQQAIDGLTILLQAMDQAMESKR